MDEKAVVEAILPSKDVDAFHPVNVGKIMIGDFDFLPCTPAGVMALLTEYGVEVAGKECVVVGRSNIVGKPQAMLLLHKNGTVTICHSRTRDLASVTRRADIWGLSEKGFITGDMVKERRGDRRQAEPEEVGKVKGDVDFERVSPKTSFITRYGGVGGP
jgi:methylenetetrahydrofolate dehydrogenase (NADP+)/methenyltetrahydrofolate cyclohydrolase